MPTPHELGATHFIEKANWTVDGVEFKASCGLVFRVVVDQLTALLQLHIKLSSLCLANQVSLQQLAWLLNLGAEYSSWDTLVQQNWEAPTASLQILNHQLKFKLQEKQRNEYVFVGEVSTTTTCHLFLAALRTIELETDDRSTEIVVSMPWFALDTPLSELAAYYQQLLHKESYRDELLAWFKTQFYIALFTNVPLCIEVRRDLAVEHRKLVDEIMLFLAGACGVSFECQSISPDDPPDDPSDAPVRYFVDPGTSSYGSTV